MASDQTQKLIEAESPLIDIQSSEAVFQYAKWALIISIFGRAILILISLKKLSICKVFYSYNTLV